MLALVVVSLVFSVISALAGVYCALVAVQGCPGRRAEATAAELGAMFDSFLESQQELQQRAEKLAKRATSERVRAERARGEAHHGQEHDEQQPSAEERAAAQLYASVAAMRGREID